jgi:glycosyltransferase involved in cell wall biosynthesis
MHILKNIFKTVFFLKLFIWFLQIKLIEAIIIKLPITAIVITKNEARNLDACLLSISAYVDNIVLVDSDSNDGTLKIAKKYKCKIYNFPAATQSSIYKWIFSNIKITTNDILTNERKTYYQDEQSNVLKYYYCVNTCYIKVV